MKENRIANARNKTGITGVVCLALLLLAHVAGAQSADSLEAKSVKLPVAFGEQKKESLLGSQAAVEGRRLESVPAAQTEGALYGLLPGLYLVKASGKPGEDQPSVLLRGQPPLVVIDGVPRSFTSIDPEQIESVSVFKDALATAMYGMRAANGVLYIKTRRGTVRPKKISFTMQSALQQQLSRPSFLNAYDYASLFNEALANDGKAAVYTAADLEKYKTGVNPFTHPDVDWYNTILRDKAWSSRYNLNFSGGTKLARYFVDLDYLNQQGFFVTDKKQNSYETNDFYKRYIFRSNVDVDLTDHTLMSLNLFGRIRNGNEPGAGTDAVYNSLLATPNNAYPIVNADGTLGGNPQFTNNLYAQTLRSGYQPSYNRNLGVDLSLRQGLDNLLKGLYVKGLASLNTYYSEIINRSKSFAVYKYTVNPAGDTTKQKLGSDGVQSNSSNVTSQNRQIYTELSLGYDRVAGRHGFHALLLANKDDYVAGSDLPLDNYGFSSRLQYAFAQKYFAEFTGSYTGMNRYAPGRQWGFFPAVGLGWDMAREGWFQQRLPFINALQWRITYGKTGDNSAAGYYVYRQFYNSSSTFYMGNPSTGNSTLIEAALANPNLSWEKATKFNAGTDIAFFDNRLQLSVDYYNNLYYDQLQQRGTNASAIIGNALPAENIGKKRYSGFEAALGYSGNRKEWKWNVAANASVSKSRVEYMDEVFRPYDYLKRTGLPVGQPFGLIADGFFNSQAEINSSPRVEGYNPVPGDIRYKDLNNDGIVNVFDETALGTKKPLLFYGLQAGLRWKGLDVSMLWQGVTNRNVWLMGANTFEFQEAGNGGYAQAFAHHLNRWTPATAATANYPRLSVGSNPNNQRASSFWLKDGSYLRLKTAEIGYTFPEKWTRFAKLHTVRAFVNGLNLLTLTPLERVDPEVVSWNYPNQRVVNFGINLQF